MITYSSYIKCTGSQRSLCPICWGIYWMISMPAHDGTKSGLMLELMHRLVMISNIMLEIIMRIALLLIDHLKIQLSKWNLVAKGSWNSRYYAYIAWQAWTFFASLPEFLVLDVLQIPLHPLCLPKLTGCALPTSRCNCSFGAGGHTSTGFVTELAFQPSALLRHDDFSGKNVPGEHICLWHCWY